MPGSPPPPPQLQGPGAKLQALDPGPSFQASSSRLQLPGSMSQAPAHGWPSMVAGPQSASTRQPAQLIQLMSARSSQPAFANKLHLASTSQPASASQLLPVSCSQPAQACSVSPSSHQPAQPAQQEQVLAQGQLKPRVYILLSSSKRPSMQAEKLFKRDFCIFGP